jgi:hypothetical protein
MRLRKRAEPAPAESGEFEAGGPIVVLGSGQRCGTTLAQRLLNSHPEVRIWGEHSGILNEVLGATSYLSWWNGEYGDPSREELSKHGHDGWLANLLPDDDALAVAARRYVVALFADPARADGRPRWGFKEVRYGRDTVERLRALLPETRVLHLTRDPRDVLRSLEAWERVGAIERSGIEQALTAWVEVNDGLHELRGESWLESVRYEDSIADPDEFTERVAALFDVDPARLDRSVFDRVVHSAGRQGRRERTVREFGELPAELRAMVETDRIAATAKRYGYAIG